MDKYEYSLKIDQIKAFLQEGNYKEAEMLADTINWNKIKNVNILVTLGEVYERAERYEESREILLNAYDRSPIGRNILYRLTEIAIKMKDFDSAMEYYEEFVQIAPHDAQKYILKYQLMKEKQAPVTELIPILEEFKEEEYIEEWIYELAYLYHTAGQIEECVETCDELILWFGDGAHVEKALELKKLYQPLTPAQEEKYKQFCYWKEKNTQVQDVEVKTPDSEGSLEEFGNDKDALLEQTEIIRRVESVENSIKVPIPIQDEQKVQNPVVMETYEEKKETSETSFPLLLGEESDGQMHFLTEEQIKEKKQMEGQIHITDIFTELEKNILPIVESMPQKSEKPLHTQTYPVVKESESIMDRLSDVIPKLGYGIKLKGRFEKSENRETKKEQIQNSGFYLTEEQKTIFSYFVPIQDMEEQIAKALQGMITRRKNSHAAINGNLIIQGNKGCGKTVLATGIVKVLQKENMLESGKVGKIQAKALNKKDIRILFQKVEGGCLIIEGAGELNKTAAMIVSDLLEQDRSGMFVILEDSEVGIQNALSKDKGFASKFTEVITIPIFTNEELVAFAESYANELGYKIDVVAILALHNRISGIQKADQEIKLEEIKEIVDIAIKKEANSGFRKAINILTAKRYTDDERIVLTEKDFE